GIVPVAPDFLAEVGRQCRRHAAVFILDEIQTGLGRCGRLWCGVAEAGPDVLLVGKTLGGGLVPLAAVAYDRHRIPTAASDPVLHASSFAGGALACRIGTEVVQTVRSEVFLARVRQLGARAGRRLRDALRGHPHVRDVRGRGLMLGIEFDSPATTGEVLIEAMKRGVLVTFCLNRPTVMRIYPPAVIS